MAPERRRVCNTAFTLNNGHEMPAVGLGTFQGSSWDDKAVEDSIIQALRCGYRLLDTAQFYGVEHMVGVMLMHWPWATTAAPDKGPLRKDESPTIVETWHMMEALVSERCRSIGVSNFTQKTLGELLASATVIPAVNQVELHAFNLCLQLVPYCKAKGIHVMSWR